MRTALLVDGENIHATRLAAITKGLGSVWPLSIRRAYGDVSKIQAWEDGAGFRMLHSSSGKNSADMLLAIDAMSLAFEGQVTHIILVSSDGDFSHLAHRLREMGVTVTGVGETRTPARFQKACNRFVMLPEAVIAPKPVPPKPSNKDSIANIVLEKIKAAGAAGITAANLHTEIKKDLPEFTLAQLPAKSWRSYLKDPVRASLFRMVGTGQACRVAIAKP